MIQLDRVKEVIRNILNKTSENGCTDAEVNTAIGKAKELMLKYHLSEEDLQESQESQEFNIENANCAKVNANSIGGKSYNWDQHLAVFCCEFVGAVHAIKNIKQIRRKNGFVVMKNDKPDTCTVYTFYGLEEDAKFAAELYEELSLITKTMAMMRWGTIFTGAGKAYALGFVKGLSDQIQKTEEQLRLSNSTALVVRRDALIQAKKNRVSKVFGIKFKFGKTRSNYNMEYYNEGREDGRNATIPGKSKRIGQDMKGLPYYG